MSIVPSYRISVSIDRGGTFTDCIAHVTEGNTDQKPKVIEYKLLSVDPQNYEDAPREGIRRILEMVTGLPHPKDQPISTAHLQSIRMSTTVATNALLERTGDKFAFLVTRGFADVLRISNQSRPHLFDLAINSVKVLYQSAAVEIDERVTLVGYSAGGGFSTMVSKAEAAANGYVRGVTGEYVRILKPLDMEQVKSVLRRLFDQGIRNIAVCLLHSFTYPVHEQQIGKLAREMGFTNISLSSSVIPMIKIVPRASSTCIDAYLTPCIQQYISKFASGFDDNLFRNVNVLFMQSSGGLVPVSKFSGFRAILSGPAGGVVGYSKTSYSEHTKIPLIGFDMGGTSTDVSRFSGHFEEVIESTTAGINVHVPQLDINTVAAGGGSRLFYRQGLLHVGPESAGAHPGPSCYRKGGPLAITDANLVLGRIIPEFFPKIFGTTEDQPLDPTSSKKQFSLLLSQIEKFTKDDDTSSIIPKSIDELAYGFIQVANEAMCRPIRELTQAKGHDTKNHILVCFGGAGGQHACALAKNLGIKKVFIHKYASVLSAYGLALADVVSEHQEPAALIYNQNSTEIKNRLTNLSIVAKEDLLKQGFKDEAISFEYYLNMRYNGSDCVLMVLSTSLSENVDFEALFLQNYKREFGFILHNRDIYVDDIRVKAIGKNSSAFKVEDFEFECENVKEGMECHTTSFYFGGGWMATRVYKLQHLSASTKINGPAILLNENNTIVVEPDCQARITVNQNVVIDVCSDSVQSNSTVLDPIQLSIFSHRFMSIAEQMGRVLQRTSVSTNIKERLDFSCALFASDGGLVANAPHIPVHLGSMQDAVRFQVEYNKDSINDGDVFVTNHPSAGGSHLPDITVITPVFHAGKIVFFVASRGHHADIGGISPGSMPPNSKYLFEEGAAVKSFKIVERGEFKEEGMTKILLHDPAKYPNCSGTRNLEDNISDLRAQIASNHQGIQLVGALIREYGLETVLAYMKYIRDNAEMSVRNLLKKVSKQHGNVLKASDQLDDGSTISVAITIDQSDGTATFDFANTSAQVYGNINAPKSVTYSAVIYCLRCLVGQDIPLNEGCLVPTKIIIPDGSLLSPDEGRAVVGGNVLTSQRLVDVILRAFKACSASQGCMNNLTFGMPSDPSTGRQGWGYYETIAGGSGAGPSWEGTDGIHTHMTNTRITDPEILERRYPVLLKQFSIREGSGGRGKFRGGHGVIRRLEFLEPMDVSILSERRVFCPYGMAGGEDGLRGENHLITSGRKVNLGGKCTVTVSKGDILDIQTPGGGGYGNIASCN